MSTRQDAWTKDEDVLLAETVLRYIREGKTQMKAFEEVGQRLSRTPQACGFRWNANLRKHYRKAIELAKQSRKKLNEQPIEHNYSEDSFDIGDRRLMTFDQVIRQLELLKGDFYKQEDISHHSDLSDVSSLRKKVEEYEKVIDEIYEKINEVKGRTQETK